MEFTRLRKHPSRKYWIPILGDGNPILVFITVFLPAMVILIISLWLVAVAYYGPSCNMNPAEIGLFLLGADLPKSRCMQVVSDMDAGYDAWQIIAFTIRFLAPPILVAAIISLVLRPSFVFTKASRLYLQKYKGGHRLVFRIYNATQNVVVGADFSAALRVGNHEKSEASSAKPAILPKSILLIKGAGDPANRGDWVESVRYKLCLPRVPIKVFVPLEADDVAVDAKSQKIKLEKVQGHSLLESTELLGAFLNFTIQGHFQRIGAQFVEVNEYGISPRLNQYVVGEPGELVCSPKARKAKSSKQASTWEGWDWFDTTLEEQLADPKFGKLLDKLDQVFPGMKDAFYPNEDDNKETRSDQ